MRRGWTLDPQDWLRLWAALGSTHKWRSVVMSDVSSEAVPNSPGVYALCSYPPGISSGVSGNLFAKLYGAVYVGRTDDLRSRFLQHCHSREELIVAARSCYSQLHFWFTRMDEPKTKSIESLMISCLGPPANKNAGAILATIGPGEPA